MVGQREREKEREVPLPDSSTTLTSWMAPSLKVILRVEPTRRISDIGWSSLLERVSYCVEKRIGMIPFSPSLRPP